MTRKYYVEQMRKQATYTVGEKVKYLRTGAGLSQVELAEKSGISQGAVSNAEIGYRVLNVYTVGQICKGLGITLSEFFEDVELD